ncbi:FAD:protein FMN transferase [Desulfofustis glycolicus]|uniref:FAD:protein FMN transferase n=1 Tax=Desulfofustis glycolicus DSM 9705 TaxID=1121409 RepID=A0A1M5VIU2_9BACT|nr:FAD:protein FMN transferase [Desulfofustis glycolicus]MCB2217617.1 FAD:protein FMN transferase [Desulfobulbaceae bacterium]SHH75108.1 thiamine biosynthesis lipoprotein [Desulfofustis glycolicus DSM 9705]
MSEKYDNCDRKRRSFLKYSGLLGLGTVAASLLPTEHAEALLFNKNEYKVTKTRLAMGTFVAMTAIHPSRDQAEEAFGRAFDEITRLSRLFNRHDTSSPLAELNRAGRLSDVPGELRDVVVQSLTFHHQTRGGFDVTVAPLVDLYQACAAAGREPNESEISRVLRVTGGEGVRVDGHSLTFARQGMGITLDGIAKGYIVDRASAALRRHGIDNHLINAGGDIRTSGHAARGKKWSVAIQDPQKRKAYPDIINMESGAIATSGNYEVYYDREKLFHHIVNGRSGHSPRLSASVSVLAPTVIEADALSTAVFVLEPRDGIDFINHRPGCDCLIVGRQGDIHSSAGWIG